MQPTNAPSSAVNKWKDSTIKRISLFSADIQNNVLLWIWDWNMRMKAVSDAGNHDRSVHKILIRFNLLTYARCMNIQSFLLLSRIVLKTTLDIYLLRVIIRWWPRPALNYCAVLLTLESSKSAPTCAQNQSFVDESLKQGLVECCPAPLHIRWVKAVF